LSSQDQASAFRVPDGGPASSSLTIPRNAKRAVFTISACGQAKDEEFWWSNVPSSKVASFENNTMPGASPWRELQLLIDGKLAGFVWPFPVIFTGGVVPGFWRPIVGIDAYDLKEDEIDITPWLPVLSDGKNHTYEIRVVGLVDDGDGNAKITSVGSNWVVTGKIFLWLSQPKSITKGDPPVVTAAEPEFIVKSHILKDEKGNNMTVNYHVLARRRFLVNATVVTADGSKPASWSQELTYSNIGNITAGGNNQTNKQVTIGLDVSSEGYSRLIKYPIWCKSSAVSDDKTKSFSLFGDINRGKFFQINGSSVFPSGLDAFDTPGAPVEKGYSTNTTQEGSAVYESLPAQNKTIGRGLTEQVFVFTREYGENNTESSSPTEMLYTRHVVAENGKILKDETITFVELNPTEPPPIRQQQLPDAVSAPGRMDVSGLISRKYSRVSGSSVIANLGEPVRQMHNLPPPAQLYIANGKRQRKRWYQLRSHLISNIPSCKFISYSV
jgi:Peptide N-acetyl-beta-D-glucosaminyl asparaginase amidase A